MEMVTSTSANKKCCLTCEFLPAATTVASDPIVSLKVTLLEQPTTCDKDPSMPFGNTDVREDGKNCPFYQKSHLLEAYRQSHGAIAKEESPNPEQSKALEKTPEKTIKISARMDPPEAGTITVGPLMAEIKKEEPLLPGEYRYHPHSGLAWFGLGLCVVGGLGLAPVIVLLIDCILTSSKLDASSPSYAADAASLHEKIVLTIVFGSIAFLFFLVGGFLVAFGGYREKQAKKKGHSLN